MNIVLHTGHVPGRIRRVSSTRFPGAMHWGVEDWCPDMNGQPRMWHAQKGATCCAARVTRNILLASQAKLYGLLKVTRNGFQ